MGITRIKFACLLLLLSKYTAFIFLFCITGCAKPFQPPPYPYEYWYKKGVSVEEVQQAMKECEYSIYESIERFTEYNEMAKKHICMMKKGFKYNGEYGTYCHQYPNLPACVEAREEAAKKSNKGN
ncbi:MAG: hypothetical protein U1E78_03030 [Gammaproteobacteria bacterium]